MLQSRPRILVACSVLSVSLAAPRAQAQSPTVAAAGAATEPAPSAAPAPSPAPAPVLDAPRAGEVDDAPKPKDVEPGRGVGLMGAGGGVLAVSLSLLVVGLRRADGSGEDLTGGSGLIAVSMLGLLAGAALVGYGGNKHRRWRKWKSEHPAVAPRVSRTGFGTWTAGVTMHF